MADLDWKKIVATVAPAVAGAFGTPAMGAAVAVLSNAIFGRDDASADDVATAIAGGHLSGDQIAAIRKADQDFAIEMARIDQAREQAGLQDTSNARQQTVSLAQAGSKIAWGAPTVSVLIVAGYFFCIYRLFIVPADLPPNAFQLLNVMFGALSIAFGQVCNYWLGSSAGSKASGDAVRNIAQQQASKG